jgi:hypothetical protein
MEKAEVKVLAYQLGTALCKLKCLEAEFHEIQERLIAYSHVRKSEQQQKTRKLVTVNVTDGVGEDMSVDSN